MMPRTGPGSSNAGFTYLGLIILVAILGLVGGASLKLGSLLQRAAAEQELLDIGAAFSDALQSYAAVTPKGQPPQPLTLQELLKDPRFPGPRRHLRKIFVDPISGKAEWGIIYLGDKAGVIGVYSLSQARPLKIANFDARFLDFENKEHLSEWRFTVSGQGAPVAPVQPLLAPPAASAPPAPQPAAPAPPAASAPPAPQPAAPAPPADQPPPDQPPPEEQPER